MTMTLKVTMRDKTKKMEALRSEGLVPAVVYGPKQPSTTIVIDGKTFEKILPEAGESTILTLSGLDSQLEVLIKDVSFDPVRKRVSHVDFYAIEQGKEITVDVPIHFIGEAPAEVDKLGVVNKALHEVEVTCRPSVLPSYINVDLAELKTIDDQIFVRDLSIPAGVTVETEADALVVGITHFATDEAEESGPTETEVLAEEKPTN